MVEVYAIHLLPEEEFLKVSGQLMGYMPVKAQERFSRFGKGADVQRSMLGEILARYLISARLNISSHEISFTVGPNGKPAFQERDDVHFNISHSGQWAVCALAAVPVGVDVEHLRKVNPSLAERFFSPDEVASLRALPAEMQDEKFIQLWTLKESFLKAIGRGLTRSLNSFSIRQQDVIYTITGDDSAGDYRLRLFDLALDYMLAACAPSDDFRETVEVITVDRMLKAMATGA